ncbi:metal ABC transporter substrate-binding protein [soil metagenome]
MFLMLLIVLTIVFFIFALNSNKTSETSSDKIQITTSFYPLYFFASTITADKANVVNITPAGAEPHDYEPTTDDILKINNSKLLILNGQVEPWANKIRSEISNKNTIILEVGDGLLSQNDPHIWLSPVIAKQIVQKISDQIISIDPSNEVLYKENTNKLEDDLDKLNLDYKIGLGNCTKTDIVTSHAAFSYLASAYGFKQIAIAGLSPDAEPSLKDLTTVSSFAKQNNIKYIFFESLVSPKLAQTIANEVGAKTLVLNPLEGLTNNDIKSGMTYLTVMEENLQNLRIALDCK